VFAATTHTPAPAGVEWVEVLLESVAPPLVTVDGEAYGVVDIRALVTA